MPTKYAKRKYLLILFFFSYGFIFGQDLVQKDSIAIVLDKASKARESNDITKAFLLCNEADSLIKKKSDDAKYILLNLELSKINYSIYDSLNSSFHIEKAIKIASSFKIKDNILLGDLFYQKARVKYWFDKHEGFDEIIPTIKTSLAYFKKAENKQRIYQSMDFLAANYIDIGILEEAEKLLFESLELKKGNKYEEAISYNNLGILYFNKYKEKKAISYYKKAIDISKELNNYELLRTSYFNISAVYQALNEVDTTVFFLLKEREAYDSIKQQQKEELVYDLQTQYQTREKEQENIILKKDSELKNQQINYTLIALASLLLVTIIIFYFYKKTNKLNKIISIQNKELEKLNIFKNQLFSIMGHDIRGMMYKLNLSQRKIARISHHSEDNKLNNNVKKMGGMIKNLNSFIENILYWGFSQTDKLHFNNESLNINRTLDQVLLNFEYDLENKNIKIIKNIPNDSQLIGDNNTIKVILRNLIANAIKYSDKGKAIYFSVLENKSFTELEIKDEGKGISKDIIPLLFETNNEKITTGTAGEKGTGLGLWLCKDMMKKNKGNIRVESEEGKGTSFILQFPKSIEHE